MPEKIEVDCHHIDPAQLIKLIGKNNIDEIIDNLISGLPHLKETIAEQTNIKVDFNTVAISIRTGEFDEEFITSEHFALHFTDKTSNKKAARSLRLAYIFTYLAKQLKEHSSLMRAWLAASQAQYYMGYCSGLYDPTIRTTISRASKGGKAKAKKMENLKQAIIEALEKHKPQNGWRNSNAASDKIIDNVIMSPHHSDNFPTLDRNDIIAVIRNMIEDDKNLKNTYIKN